MDSSFLQKRLLYRQETGLYRQLRVIDSLVDFCSNDYLGFARSIALKDAIQYAQKQHTGAFTGATGSRLLAGHTHLADKLETALAQFYGTEAALVFNSGYDANLGLLASLPQRGDTLITDELVHASMIDGARLSYATRHRFRHNDLNELETILRQPRVGQTFVAIESVYSMDGDMAPLTDLVNLCERYQAHLIVDEAHATGIYGPRGEGLVVALGLEQQVFARVHTFGKALGVHGAAVVGSALLRDYLINMARSFIYTTALPPHSLLAIACAHDQVQQQPALQAVLQDRVRYFRQEASRLLPNVDWTNSVSPVQGLIVPGNECCKQVAAMAHQAGFDVRAIVSPTVPAGTERLRICIHAFNTPAEITALMEVLRKGIGA